MNKMGDFVEYRDRGMTNKKIGVLDAIAFVVEIFVAPSSIP